MPGPRLLRLASDARLVGFVREGRTGAFDAVYDRHSRGILSFCRHMLGDQHEAEDAVQHTFMSAYTSLLASQQPIHLRPWLFAIARNRCYSILRSQRERPVAELEEPVTDGLAAEVQRRQDLQDLVSDLNRLPEEQRAAIILAELESLSHAEIATALGVPRDKVKALVFQARESLLASRTARDTACHEIRQQLAVGRGGALRRSNLRRHLRDCEGCRAYRAQVQHQRRQFGFLLPVAPTILAKEGLLAAAVGAGGAAAVGGSGLVATGALKTGLLKGVAAAVIAGVGTLGTVVVSATDLPVRALESGSGHGHHAPVAHHAGAAAAARAAGGASAAGGAESSATATAAGSSVSGTDARLAAGGAALVGHRRMHGSSARHHRAAVERGRGGARHSHGMAPGYLRHHLVAAVPGRHGWVLSGPGSLGPGFFGPGPGEHVPPGLADRVVPGPGPGQGRWLNSALGGRPGHVPFGLWHHGHGIADHGHAWGHVAAAASYGGEVPAHSVSGTPHPVVRSRHPGARAWHPGARSWHPGARSWHPAATSWHPAARVGHGHRAGRRWADHPARHLFVEGRLVAGRHGRTLGGLHGHAWAAAAHGHRWAAPHGHPWAAPHRHAWGAPHRGLSIGSQGRGARHLFARGHGHGRGRH